MTVTVYAPGGTSVEVIARAPAPPTITGVTVTPSVIAPGGQASINAVVTGADTVMLDGIIVTLPKTVTPSTTKTYTLTASGPGGDAAPVQVVVTVQAVTLPVVHIQVLDYETDSTKPGYKTLRNHTCLDFQFARGQAYYRTGDSNQPYQGPFTTAAFNLGFGTTAAKFDYPAYGLAVNGIEVARVNVAAGTRANRFAGNWPANTPSGPAQLDILAYDASGNRVTSTIGSMGSVRVIFDLDGTAKDHPDFFAQIPNFSWSHPGKDSWDATRYVPPTYAWAQMPRSVIAAVAEPLVPRAVVEEFNTVIPASGLHVINLIPGPGDVDYLESFEPLYLDSGVVVTDNMQPYFTDGFMKDQPQRPIIPGPRGIARASHFTYLKFTERPNPSLKLLWGNNYAVGAFDNDGTMSVHFGFYSTYPAHWSEINKAIAAGVLHKSLAIRGKWSASVPPLQRNAQRPWFKIDDRSTTVTNPNEPQINGEAPHGDPITGAPLNPTSFYGDSRGFVLRAVFDGHDRSLEPTVDRFITEPGLWGGAEYQNQIVTGSRQTHRIALWNMKTGAWINNVISVPEAAAVGSIDPTDDKFVYAPGKGLADARALPMCFVEAIAVMDDWLYFTSKAQAEVRRWHLITGQLQICARIYISDTQSKFVNLAVSDGRFGPRHMFSTCTFDNQVRNRPRWFVPTPSTGTDGVALTHTEYNAGNNGWIGSSFSHDLQRGNVAQTGVYPMAMAFGSGAYACAGSEENVAIYVKRQLGDPIYDDAKAQAGHQDFRANCLQLVHNTMGRRFTSYALPRGANAMRDYWFDALGRA